MRYIVYVNDEDFGGEIYSFEEAQKVAAPYTEGGSLVKIEGYLTNAPTSIWNYSPDEKEWIKCESQ